MKGVILSGGQGTRLRPLTNVVNKHLLPVYDKTMIEYPIETLKHLGVKEILIVTGGENIGKFAEYLGDGKDFGVDITYKIQREASGIAGALKLARGFAQGERIAVVLGDNVFDNMGVSYQESDNAILFVKEVSDGSRFGVIEFDGEPRIPSRVRQIIEKPVNPPSSFAVTGLYIYPSDVFDIIDGIVPSERGELEITDVNNYYVNEGRIQLSQVRGYWSDVGTFESLLRTQNWIQAYK